MIRIFRILCVLAWAVVVVCNGAAADWPQRACTPQRTGASPDTPVPPFNSYTHVISGERIGGWHQPIIAGGRVFVGTIEGGLHCWPVAVKEYNLMRSVEKKENLWVFRARGPIVQSAGHESGRVFFGSMDGCAYALDAETGGLVWKTEVGRPGFSTAALIAEGKLFLGGRGGAMCAFDLESGNILWQFEAGGPFFASAAYDAGVVFAPAEDMRIYALDAGTGKLVWRSEPLHGAGFREYYPVVASGRVVMRTCPHIVPANKSVSYSRQDRIRIDLRPPDTRDYAMGSMYIFPFGAAEAGEEYWRNPDAPRGERLAAFSESVRKAFELEPGTLTFHVLDAETGRRAFVAPVVYNAVQNGPGVPPVAGPDGCWYAATTVTCVGNTCMMAKIDPETGDIVDVLQDYVGGGADGWGGRYYTVMPDGSLSDELFLKGGWTGDEDNHFSVGGNVLYGRHGHGGWDGIDLSERIAFSGRVKPWELGNIGANSYCGFAISGRHMAGPSICGSGMVRCFEGAGD